MLVWIFLGVILKFISVLLCSAWGCLVLVEGLILLSPKRGFLGTWFLLQNPHKILIFTMFCDGKGS